MKVVKVPKIKAEEVRRFAEKIGAKDKRRLITFDGSFVYIPIYDGFERHFSEFEVVEDENPVFAKKYDIKRLAREKFSEDVSKGIVSFKVLGSLAIVKLEGKAREFGEKIGELILETFPRLKAVWCDEGKEGMERKPKMTLLAGKGSVTVHKEHDCLLKVDVTKVMYSLGNQYEKLRVANLVKEGEIVLDMFAGIGYFTIPIANHSKAEKIYAFEINFDAYKLLLENLKLNKIRNVIAVNMDSRFTPEGFADRVVMGHIFAEDFIEVAVRALNGEGYIHYHESVPEKIIERPIKRIEAICKKLNREVKILGMRKVKNYSPGVVHVVVDAYVR